MNIKLKKILVEPKLMLKDFYHFFSNNYKWPRSYFFTLLPYQFFRINLDNFLTTKFQKKFINKYKKEYPDMPPVKGYVTRGLNIDRNHFGIDIAAKYKDNIYSSGYGKVIFSGMNKDLGNTIIINHPGGFVTVYAHNDTNLVFSGDLVEKGQIVAYIGETGNSQGPHLHFEIWKNDQVLDPRGIIQEYDKKDVSIR